MAKEGNKEGNNEEAGKEAFIGKALDDLAKEAPTIWQYLLDFGQYYSEENWLVGTLAQLIIEASKANDAKIKKYGQASGENAAPETRLSLALLTATGTVSTLGVLLSIACPGVLHEQAPMLMKVLERIKDYESSDRYNANEAASLADKLAEAQEKLLRKALECTLSLRGLKLEIDNKRQEMHIVYRGKNNVAYRIHL